MPRSSLSGHNTGPRKLPDRSMYRASRVPLAARRCWKACRPVIGFVLCVAVGMILAIAAGTVILYLLIQHRH